MENFKGTKQEKAMHHAKKVWGVYFDDKHPDIAITETCGKITVKDYLAGYEQAYSDSKAPEMLECLQSLKNDNNAIPKFMWDRIQSLIKSATEL